MVNHLLYIEPIEALEHIFVFYYLLRVGKNHKNLRNICEVFGGFLGFFRGFGVFLYLKFKNIYII